MAKSISEVIGGIFCCMEGHYAEEPWCNDCPYENIYDCKNVLQSDITYWAKLGKLELGQNGIWQEVGGGYNPKPKSKRKNGRRYFDGERRNSRQYETDDF